MASIFLDANEFFDLLTKKLDPQSFNAMRLYVSTLSVHIACYTLKITMPNVNLNETLSTVTIVDLTHDTLMKAISGPTSDLEDNIQLHSATEAACDVFLTHDRALVKMAFFGKTRITSSLTA